MKQTRIIVADDHPLILAGLKALVQADPTMQIIGEAKDGQSALQLATELKPDLIVLDLSMPGMHGIRVAQTLLMQCPSSHILILTVHEDQAYLRRLLEMGVSGYVLKRSASEELITAIRAVATGGIYLDPAIAAMVVKLGPHRKFGHHVRLAAELSNREGEVLQLAAAGYSNKEISSRLQVGVKTIETYKTRAMDKLGLDTRAQLVRYAIVKGWLDSP
jgi:DNA-binding NarL/FixJ family response regulator